MSLDSDSDSDSELIYSALTSKLETYTCNKQACNRIKKKCKVTEAFLRTYALHLSSLNKVFKITPGDLCMVSMKKPLSQRPP